MDDAKAADLFDGVAEHYDAELFHTTVAGALIDGLSDMSPPELILDIATGTGSAAFAALRLYPARVLAVDISPNMIAHAGGLEQFFIPGFEDVTEPLVTRLMFGGAP